MGKREASGPGKQGHSVKPDQTRGQTRGEGERGHDVGKTWVWGILVAAGLTTGTRH